MTNGDRIRQMTDEEFVDAIFQISQCCGNDASCKLCPLYDSCSQNEALIERWLKQEAKEEAANEVRPVRHGRWIPIEFDSYADGAPVWDKWECSECGHEHRGEEDTLTAFCPDCGAKMDGGEEQ